jgi:choline dehydrogenase
VEGEEIVLSVGGLRSPHLLMLSGVGPADHLRSMGVPVLHHLPGVARICGTILVLVSRCA